MNFDEKTDRRLFPSLKWSKEFLSEYFGNAEALPMSVADMDLKSPPSVIAALKKRSAHGIYGYEYRADSYSNAIESWYKNRHGWEIEKEQIESSPSVMNAISILINQQSEEGDGVILQTPVFFEFRKIIRTNKRKVVRNPLQFIDGKYLIDFEDLTSKAAQEENKILILCNPHNHVGRVWTEKELSKIATICVKHGVFVISDEIHGDYVFPPYRYTPYLTISHDAEQNSAACISPAKTFNIAGIVDAAAVIPNNIYRQQFHEFTNMYQINKVNVFTSAAAEAAYKDGANWLDALLEYLQGNIDYIRDFLMKSNIGISLIEPEGTFLAWLDFRRLGFNAKELEQFLAKEAEIALSQGYWYGREGAGFARMTAACPRLTIRRAMEKLVAAVEKIDKS